MVPCRPECTCTFGNAALNVVCSQNAEWRSRPQLRRILLLAVGKIHPKLSDYQYGVVVREIVCGHGRGMRGPIEAGVALWRDRTLDSLNPDPV
jgi:hypothetical protein